MIDDIKSGISQKNVFIKYLESMFILLVGFENFNFSKNSKKHPGVISSKKVFKLSVVRN